MDKTPREVTDKIRGAIKNKLVELNLFVDNELPDYIMILIANKRSKHHMENDLTLFLGTQTKAFTNWLWNLVYNFKVGTHTKSAKSPAVLDSDIVQDPKETRIEEDDVLNYDPAEEGETLCLDEISKNVSSQLVIPQTVQIKSETKSTVAETSKISHATPPTLTPPMTMKVVESSQIEIPKVDKIPRIDELPSNIPKKTNVLKTQSSSTVKSAKVYPFSQSKPNLFSEHEGVKPVVKAGEPKQPDLAGGVNSVVCITQRKYKGPAALQANKLLLKAVNEATKSVLNGRSIEDYYKPTIKCLPSPQLENSITPEHNSSNEITTEKNLVSEQQQVVTVKPFEMNEVSNSSDEALINTLESEYKFEDSNPLRSLVHHYCPTEEKDVMTPHFIVTLDGINLSSLKRKHSIEEPMDIEDEEEVMEEFEEEEEYTKKRKLNERCKYWPACKNTNCYYHHPTIPCKCFPDCTFGEKCLYVHPNCKFDTLCSRKDCPYTHCSKRRFKAPCPAIIKPPVKLQSAKVVCRYYPKCTAKSCRFLHPKLCRFGTQCRTPTCRFSHFQVPQRAQLKWKAGSS